VHPKQFEFALVEVGNADDHAGMRELVQQVIARAPSFPIPAFGFPQSVFWVPPAVIIYEDLR
jgi:hypothetical protein